MQVVPFPPPDAFATCFDDVAAGRDDHAFVPDEELLRAEEAEPIDVDTA